MAFQDQHTFLNMTGINVDKKYWQTMIWILLSLYSLKPDIPIASGPQRNVLNLTCIKHIYIH